MSARINFLTICAFVLLPACFAPAESIDVNNGSFELDINGVQIDWKEGTMEHVLAWENTPGLSGYAGVNGSLSKHPGSDGRTYAWGHNYDGGSGFFQVLDHMIVPGKHYTVIYDAKNLWQDEPNHTTSFFYVEGDSHIELGSQDYLITTENTDVWDNLDIEMLWTALPDQPYIGKPLGIKFYFPPLGNTIYTGIDNVRLKSIDACYAWKPQPEDGTVEMAKSVTLSWNPGLWAGSHEVYFGTSFMEVNDADTSTPDIFRGSGDVLGPDGEGRYSYTPPEVPLIIGKTYYWRVDEVNDTYGGPVPPAPPNGRWKGEVWRFRITGYAINPYPADGATDVLMNTSLSWTTGTDANQHEIYFGTSFEDVNTAVAGSAEHLATQAVDANNYDVSGELMLSEIFYWRIDEVNELTLKGDVWQFTTRNYLVVENFDNYKRVQDLSAVWEDGNYNETGSEISVESLTVRDGNSLNYMYNNDWYYYSEIEAATANLGVGSNWKYGGTKSLVLWFYGDGGNDADEQMYVVLEDSVGRDAEVHYYGDMNDIRLAEWQEWNIGLDEFTDENSALDLTDTVKIYIGFGERGGTTSGGTGEVWFEDIRLYAIRCVPKMAYMTGSFDGDCFTDYTDLSMMSGDWLLRGRDVLAEVPGDVPIISYQFETQSGTTVVNSGDWDSSYNGTFGPNPHDPAWVVGGYDETGGLLFDNADLGEEGDYVSIDNPLNLNSNTVSITAWIKRNGEQVIYAPIVFTRGDADAGNHSTVGLGLGSTADDGDPAWAVNHELCYHWADAENSWAWHNGMIVPDGVWTFIAVAVAPDSASLYMSDGSSIQAATNYAYHEPEEFDGIMYLCQDTHSVDRHFEGTIDDVRIYNRTLSAGEVMGIAGLSGWHYLPLESWRTDIDKDDDVDMGDYATLAGYWLEEVLFPFD